MFELIIESERVDAKKNNIIQISTELTRYILLVDNLVEFDITNQIEPTIEFNFKSKEVSTTNIIFISGECLHNIPFRGRIKE